MGREGICGWRPLAIGSCSTGRALLSAEGGASAINIVGTDSAMLTELAAGRRGSFDMSEEMGVRLMLSTEDIRRLRVIDTDAHVTEPADLWTSRLPKKWEDRIQACRGIQRQGCPTGGSVTTG